MIFSKASEKKTTKARSKPSEYEAMLRNGFIMPKLNSTIVNKIYMYRVKSKLEYCPMTTDIKAFKICINPPSKDYLLSQIQEELIKQKDQRDLTYDAGHLPDVEWCVKALLALNPNHHIFDKDYVPSIHEKCRKGTKNEQNYHEEELKRFEEFDKGLPAYLHQSIMKSNTRFTGRHYQPKNEVMENDDGTLTDKDIQDENEDVQNQSINYIQKQENTNPFINQISRNNIFFKNTNKLQMSPNSFFENPTKSQTQIQVQSQSSSKNIDLQQSIKQLSTQLFPSNISKNKSKKKLSSQEEEMIVSMFEKLVVNCKGRPVDFVKTYLDQYHSEKKSQGHFTTNRSIQNSPSDELQGEPEKSFMSSNIGNFNYFVKDHNSISKSHQEHSSYVHNVLQTSSSKQKILNFSPFQQHQTQQFNSNENQVKVNQLESELLAKDKTQNCDTHMISQNEIADENNENLHIKEILQSEFEGSSNFTSGINGNSDTVQSLSSFNQSQSHKQQIFNI